jgi:two-component system OmpR family sensor kinase
VTAGDQPLPASHVAREPQASRLRETLERLLTVPATDIEAALTTAAQHIAEVLGADKVDAFLFDPATQSLVALGTSPTPMGRRQQELGLDHLPLADGGRTAHVFQTGTPFLDGHVDQDPEELQGIKDGLGVRSTLTVPLFVSDERRGVLLVSSAQPESFSPVDLQSLTAIATWVGMVAHRAELTERAAAQQRDAEREALRRTLLAAVSHELLTPLTIIKGHADTLHDPQTRADPGLAEGALTAIDDEVERLRRLIGNLLDVTRATTGHLTLTFTLVDVRALIETAVRRFQGRSRRHRFVTDLPEDLPRAMADRERLEGVLYNLLDNAIKYAPRGGTVTIRAAVTGASLEITVVDYGRGIGAEHLDQVFEPYYRVPAGEAGPEGAGLGLYISKVIVEAHGGRIWVESQVGRATAVHVMLPLAGG